MRVARAQEVPQQDRVFGRHGACYRRALRKRRAPCGDFWQTGEDAEVADTIESIEITKHRTEYGSDQAESLAVEPRTLEAGIDARELGEQGENFSRECSVFRSVIQSRNVVEDCRAKFDPGAMLRPRERIGGMQC